MCASGVFDARILCIKTEAWQSEVPMEMDGQVSYINYGQEALDYGVFIKSEESRPRNQRLTQKSTKEI